MKITAKKKLTKDCFKDFWYRDSDIDALLPKEQLAQTGEISVITFDADMTFLEMAQKYLGTQDPQEIKKHCLTLPMVEKLIKSADTNGLNTKSYANFFFVENANGSVSVADVRRYGDGRRWRAHVRGLADCRRWGADDRLMVCNLETRTLGNSDPVSNLEQRVEALEERMESILKAFRNI